MNYLEPTTHIDSDAANVIAFARQAVGDERDDVAKSVRLYYAVRDAIVYTPYCDFYAPDTFRASGVLAKGSGFCVGKASLLAATARASGIPARVGFADVRNHLCTPRLRALIGGVEGATNLAELGIGLNPQARIGDDITETKKRAGTAHFALGDNAGGYGGIVESPVHLDGMLFDVTVEVDGDQVVRDGRVLV
jgi:hypothetical protein